MKLLQMKSLVMDQNPTRSVILPYLNAKIFIVVKNTNHLFKNLKILIVIK